MENPAFLAAAAVTGPMQAIFTPWGSLKLLPAILIKLCTVDELVKVITSA